MNSIVTIFLSLLLVGSQTFTVASPAGGGAAVTTPGCCCDACQCCVSQSDVPGAPVPQAPASVSAHPLPAIPPTALVRSTRGASCDEILPLSTAAEFRADAMPLFQRLCVFLI